MQVKKVKQIMNQADITSTIDKMVEQISANFQNELSNVRFVGIVRRGVSVAQIAANIFKQKTDIALSVAPLKIKIYEDDLSYASPLGESLENPDGFNGKIIIAWDDVAWTLATLEKAFGLITANAKPQKIVFAVLVDRFDWHDRGKANFAPQIIGVKQSTTAKQIVKVCFEETGDGETSVWLCEKEEDNE